MNIRITDLLDDYYDDFVTLPPPEQVLSSASGSTKSAPHPPKGKHRMKKLLAVAAALLLAVSGLFAGALRLGYGGAGSGGSAAPGSASPPAVTQWGRMIRTLRSSPMRSYPTAIPRSLQAQQMASSFVFQMSSWKTTALPPTTVLLCPSVRTHPWSSWYFSLRILPEPMTDSCGPSHRPPFRTTSRLSPPALRRRRPSICKMPVRWVKRAI